MPLVDSWLFSAVQSCLDSFRKCKARAESV